MTNPSKSMESIMDIANLRRILTSIVREQGYHVEIWISSDEEGNEILPMPLDEELSIGFDEENNRIIFFPAHR